METKAFVFRKWDDLVFANRNKSYGAYVLRQAYSNRVMIGWGLSKAILLLLIAVVALRKPHEIVQGIITLPKGDHKLINYVRPVKPEPPARRITPRTERVNQNTTIQVVTTPVDNPVTENTDVAFGTPDGTDGAVAIDGLDTGLGLVETVEPVTVPEEVVIAQVMPVYTGGTEALMKFVKKHLRYSASARRQGIEGTVYVSFVVSGDGIVKKVSVLRGIHVDLDEEAMRVISMLPGWIGGKQNGLPVNVRMVLPIVFRLQ